MNLPNIKTLIKSKFPYSLNIKNYFRNVIARAKVALFDSFNINKTNAVIVFKEKAVKNGWGGNESVSGHGSDFKSTELLRTLIPSVLKEFEVKSLLDAPCGDFYWMNLTDLQIDRYVGVDIVPELIVQNQEKYTTQSRHFLNLDITSDQLPTVDLILCRDCLVHLSFNQIKEALQNFKKSGSTYLLTTTYPDLLQTNKNIITGDWRPLDLQKAPFNFPNPIKIVNENCTSDLKEKRLGLWKISDIQI